MERPSEYAPSPTHDILTTDPIVSIHLDVKKNLNPGEIFEVDYDNLRSTLKELGAPVDNSNLAIEYTSEIKDLTLATGLYNSEEQSIQVKASRKAAQMQRSLQHEIGHHVDISQRPFTHKDSLRNRLGTLGNVAQQALIPPTAIAATAYPVSYFIEIEHENIPALEVIQNVAEVANFTLAPLLLGALALSAAFYYGSPREAIARKAQRKSAPVVAHIK